VIRPFASGDAVNSRLLEPVRLGALELPDRVVMALLTPVHRQPDLVERFRTKAVLDACDSNTFYQGGDKGYFDYPLLAR